MDATAPKPPESYSRLKCEKPTELMAIPNLVIRRPSVVQVFNLLKVMNKFMEQIQGPSPNLMMKGHRLSAITSSNNSSGESSPENNNYLRVSALFGNR